MLTWAIFVQKKDMIHAMKAPNAERPYIIHSTTADAGMIRGGDMALAMLGMGLLLA